MNLEDHLRSLAGKETSGSAGVSAAPAAPAAEHSKNADPSIVSIAADDRAGKGFIVDGEGRVLTNFHLINMASRIKVTTASGDIFLGKVVRKDAARDLALLQIPTRTSVHLALGDAGSVDVGEEVTIPGPKAGERSRGVISAIRKINGTQILQVDVPLDPTNSGCPVMTSAGTVVGITTFKLGHQNESSGVAVSVNELKAFIFGL